jgi:hypothetical protein
MFQHADFFEFELLNTNPSTGTIADFLGTKWSEKWVRYIDSAEDIGVTYKSDVTIMELSIY